MMEEKKEEKENLNLVFFFSPDRYDSSFFYIKRSLGRSNKSYDCHIGERMRLDIQVVNPVLPFGHDRQKRVEQTC